MKSDRLVWVKAPSNLGLINPPYGDEPGVKYFPSVMDELGFKQLAGITEEIRVEAPPYTKEVDSVSGVRNADAIIQYSLELAAVLQNLLEKNRIPILCGGDCSILLGPAIAMKRLGKYGLFYLDGHTDYVWPEHSHTKGAAGMDLAIVTGNGHDKLTNIENIKPYLDEENVFCCGNRDHSPGYVELIEGSEVNYFDLDRMRRTGPENLVKRFLQNIANKQLDGFWVHFDVDVLDNEIMPCVDSRQPGGLSYAELAKLLESLMVSDYFKGIEITILDPILDPQRTYSGAFASEFSSIIRHAFEEHGKN